MSVSLCRLCNKCHLRHKRGVLAKLCQQTNSVLDSCSRTKQKQQRKKTTCSWSDKEYGILVASILDYAPRTYYQASLLCFIADRLPNKNARQVKSKMQKHVRSLGRGETPLFELTSHAKSRTRHGGGVKGPNKRRKLVSSVVS